MPFRLKRAYEEPATRDGMRVLVDRLWPRGLRKEDARIDLWLKEAAPSTELRRWFLADPERWDEFCRRYRRELDARARAGELTEAIEPVLDRARKRTVTLLYAKSDDEHNHALVLKEFLEEHARPK